MSISNTKDAYFFKREYPFTAYNYVVITDEGMAGFSKISGITLDSHNLKPFLEGGRKEVHILRGNDSSFNTLTLERGVGEKDVLKFLGPMRKLILLSLSANRKPQCAYYVSGAVLQKITLSDFNAKDSGVLISSVTIAYTAMKALPLDGANGVQGASGGVMLTDNGSMGEANIGNKHLPDEAIESYKSSNLAAGKIMADKLEAEKGAGEDLITLWE